MGSPSDPAAAPHHGSLPLPTSSSPASPLYHSSQHSHPFARAKGVKEDHDNLALHPTHALLHHPHPPSSSSSSPGGDLGPPVHWKWTARAHRKGVPPRPKLPKAAEEEGRGRIELRIEGRTAKSWKDGWRWVRETRWWGWDLQDISWWVAAIFTLGSVFWCIQGIQFFCYFSDTSATFTNTEAAMAFLGGTTFWIGAYLGWVESMNPAELSGTFGWEVKEEGRLLLRPKQAHPSSALGLRRRHFGSHRRSSSPASSSAPSSDPTPSSAAVSAPKWRWFAFPSFSSSSQDPVSFRNLGYLANLIQFFGATCFQVSVICGLPGVLPSSGAEGGPEQEGRVEREWVAAYWAMQIVGAPCFFVAGTIFAVETQKRWWLPNLTSIGWHIGFWNIIGGFGFFFSGLFGIWRQTSISDPAKYQYWGTAFSTFWGSWAFLIGSYLQLLETLNKWT
ncbi:hypothetical protein JCM8097_006826 [Rhodosporidiobolus ruineniae]